MVNLTPLSPAPVVRQWLSLEITREGGFIQAVATTNVRSSLVPGQVVELQLPFCKKLIVQSVNRTRITLGCWLAIYLNARPTDPEKKLPRQLDEALKGMLVARGIPLEYIDIRNSLQLGAIPRVGSDPVEAADALGYILYCDADLKVRIAPKVPLDEILGQFDMAELATFQPGDGGTLSANRIAVKGEIVKVRNIRDQDGSVVRERVSAGWRTTTTSSQIRGRRHTTTEIVLEPPSEISRFSATYEKSNDPDVLVFRFSTPVEESAIKSQQITTTTTRDNNGYIVKREKLIIGCAAKGLSSFYSAWAGASVPKPAPSTIEPPAEPTPLNQGPREYTIYGAGGENATTVGNGPQSTSLTGNQSTVAVPITLLRPTGMFDETTLLTEIETWDYGDNRVTYLREQMLPVGAIIPEAGNPMFGYQEPSDKSMPIYHDPLPLQLAERETIQWVKDDIGRWESRRTLSQVIGIRNAQEPRDAMNAVQWDAARASTMDRSVVAINVALQFKVAATSQQFSDPPGASPIEEMQEVETYTPYSEVVELEGTDLLDRTLEINPSPFCGTLEDVRKIAQYAALELRGQANSVIIGLPLSILPYDIPPNSAIELEGKPYLVSKVSANIGSAESVLSLDLWEL